MLQKWRLVMAMIIVPLVSNQKSFQVNAMNDEKDLTFSQEEREALTKIKRRPEVMGMLTDDYMKTDFYISRFLREAKNDVDKTITMLNETMAWRRANNVSLEMVHEDWSDMLEIFPMDFSSRDRMNRPVIQAVAEYWNIREEVYYGDYDRLARYANYILERCMYEIIKAREEGHLHVTRVVGLVDADGVGLSKHFCFSCVPYGTDWISNYQTHYPKLTDQLIVTNSSFIMPMALNILWPFMSEETRNLLVTFTSSSNDESNAYMDERIAVHQRLPEFGGTKIPDPVLPPDVSPGEMGEPTVTRKRVRNSGPGVTEYVEYIVVLAVAMLITVCCVYVVKVRCAKRCKARYDRCEAA